MLPDVSALSAEIVPPDPTEGVVTIQPAGDIKDTKLVPAGKISLRCTLPASKGPLLVMVIV